MQSDAVADLVKRAQWKYSPAELAVLSNLLAGARAEDAERAMFEILENRERRGTPSLSVFLSRVEVAAQRRLGAEAPSHYGPSADAGTTRLSNDACRKLISAPSSRDRAKILCEYRDALKADGKLTDALESAIRLEVNAMLRHHEADAGAPGRRSIGHAVAAVLPPEPAPDADDIF